MKHICTVCISCTQSYVRYKYITAHTILRMLYLSKYTDCNYTVITAVVELITSRLVQYFQISVRPPYSFLHSFDCSWFVMAS